MAHHHIYLLNYLQHVLCKYNCLDTHQFCSFYDTHKQICDESIHDPFYIYVPSEVLCIYIDIYLCSIFILSCSFYYLIYIYNHMKHVLLVIIIHVLLLPYEILWMVYILLYLEHIIYQKSHQEH